MFLFTNNNFIYMKSGSTWKGAAVLCHKFSTGAQNVDLHGVSSFYPDIAACIRRMGDQGGYQKTGWPFRDMQSDAEVTCCLQG